MEGAIGAKSLLTVIVVKLVVLARADEEVNGGEGIGVPLLIEVLEMDNEVAPEVELLVIVVEVVLLAALIPEVLDNDEDDIVAVLDSPRHEQTDEIIDV